MNEKQVVLKTYKLEACLDLYKKYVPDPLMTYDTFQYSAEKMTAYYHKKMSEPNRRLFSIHVNHEVIGEVQIKYIDYEKLEGTLSILLANDQYKNKGYGSQAERLVLDYAFNTLNLKRVKADATQRNERSKHILEKIGFQHIKDENLMSYYVLERGHYESKIRDFRK